MITVENLTKEFKSYKKNPGFKGTVKGLFSREVVIKKAVDNISFHIDKGEIVGYIGSNGAGKSTTIKMMTGILVPTAGRCVVNGIIPLRKPHGKRPTDWGGFRPTDPALVGFTPNGNLYDLKRNL